MQQEPKLPGKVDLIIIGGGINGAGMARDAAGRGLSVLLVEKDDLASHTSSASTKLIHGGLRYLEYGEIRLVRESLQERERLWGMAPHIIWPMRFVLPQTQSPRPAWMVRIGLFLYDHIGGRKRLPATETVRLDRSPKGEGLADRRGKGFVYSDCWVNDARLVVLNAMDAAARGAAIHTRTRFLSAHRTGKEWQVTVEGETGPATVHARAIANTAGPWVSEVIDHVEGARPKGQARLIKGSHIIVPKLFPGEHAYMLQNPDRRIVFAIPYEGEFTLIGTTDVPIDGAPRPAHIDEAEIDYLIDTANRYFARQTGRADIVWTYSGIRPLFDDQAKNASAVTRDYVLDLDRGQGDEAPLLNVFGGKITTFRRLAEHAMEQLAVPGAGNAWTAGATLPGGDFVDFDSFEDVLAVRYSGLPRGLIHRLARDYGTCADAILGSATTMADLGEDFGGGLTRAEVDYLVANEWARTAQDVLWRRSKLGLHAPKGTAERLAAYLAG